MEELLALAEGHPRRTIEAGEALIVDGEAAHPLYVLLDGALRIEKGGVPIATVTERGTCVGEMSLLLGSAATADVVASERSTIAVIENAAAMLDGETGLPVVLARAARDPAARDDRLSRRHQAPIR